YQLVALPVPAPAAEPAANLGGLLRSSVEWDQIRRLQTVRYDSDPSRRLDDSERALQSGRRLRRHAALVQIAVLPGVRLAAMLPRLFALLDALDRSQSERRDAAVRRIDHQRGSRPAERARLPGLFHPAVVVLGAVNALLDGVGDTREI